jgi:hypothetical protein
MRPADEWHSARQGYLLASNPDHTKTMIGDEAVVYHVTRRLKRKMPPPPMVFRGPRSAGWSK